MVGGDDTAEGARRADEEGLERQGEGIEGGISSRGGHDARETTYETGDTSNGASLEHGPGKRGRSVSISDRGVFGI